MGSIPQLSILKGKQSPLYPRLLHKIFEEGVDKSYGEKTALVFRDENEEERQMNYNTLNSTANRIAAALLEVIKTRCLEVNGDGDWIIAVCMKPSDHLITTLLAIWKCGGKLISKLSTTRKLIVPIAFDSRIFTVGRYVPGKSNQSHFK